MSKQSVQTLVFYCTIPTIYLIFYFQSNVVGGIEYPTNSVTKPEAAHNSGSAQKYHHHHQYSNLLDTSDFIQKQQQRRHSFNVMAVDGDDVPAPPPPPHATNVQKMIVIFKIYNKFTCTAFSLLKTTKIILFLKFKKSMFQISISKCPPSFLQPSNILAVIHLLHC